jgi:hypothetical protein
MRFCYKYPFFKINTLKNYNWFTYLFAKYGAKIGLIKKVSFNDEQSVNQSNLNLLLHSRLIFAEGWFFRNYEAFLREREGIKRLFSFRKELIQKVDANLPCISKDMIRIGIHVRRGDYIRWKDGRFFFTDEEYLKIIHSFAGCLKEKEIQIIMVTNDESIDEDVYRKALEADIIFSRGNAGEDLYALSTCDYIIGPPSTFSLMAAFYRDVPLYWIFDKNEKIDAGSFRSFDYLFRSIL